MKLPYLLVFVMTSLYSVAASAQAASASLDTTIVTLRAVIIESSKTNSPTAPLYSESIKKAKVLNARDAVLKLRPAMLSPETGSCTSEDSLSIYINGVRRITLQQPVLSPVATDSNKADLWTSAGNMLDNNVMGFRPHRKSSSFDKQSRLDWIKSELAQVPSSNIKSIYYVSCDSWSREIGMRNVIWIELND